jgi:hypothetical protein
MNNGTVQRSLARFVAAQMTVLTGEGERDDAIQLGIDLLRITRHCDSEPSQVSYLTTLAVRGIAIDALNSALQRGAVSATTNAELDAELARHDCFEQLGRALSSERAIGSSSIDKMDEGVPALLRWPKINWQVDLIDCYADAINLAELQWFEGKADLSKLQETTTTANSGPFRQQVVSGIDKTYIAANRMAAQLRCLRILNALRAYSQQHGREATALDELGLSKSTIVDPFSGQPLKFRLAAKGWIVYSVMTNGIDDSGNFTGLNDYGVGPPGHEYHSTAAENAEETEDDQKSEVP